MSDLTALDPFLSPLGVILASAQVIGYACTVGRYFSCCLYMLFLFLFLVFKLWTGCLSVCLSIRRVRSDSLIRAWRARTKTIVA